MLFNILMYATAWLAVAAGGEAGGNPFLAGGKYLITTLYQFAQ